MATRIYVRGMLKGKAVKERQPINPDELAEIFGIKKYFDELKEAEAYNAASIMRFDVHPSKIKKNAKGQEVFPQGGMYPTKFTAAIGDTNLIVELIERFEKDASGENNKPRHITMEGKSVAVPVDTKKAEAVFWLLHPCCETSPVHEAGKLQYYYYDVQAESAKEVATVKLFQDINELIMGINTEADAVAKCKVFRLNTRGKTKDIMKANLLAHLSTQFGQAARDGKKRQMEVLKTWKTKFQDHTSSVAGNVLSALELGIIMRKRIPGTNLFHFIWDAGHKKGQTVVRIPANRTSDDKNVLKDHFLNHIDTDYKTLREILLNRRSVKSKSVVEAFTEHLHPTITEEQLDEMSTKELILFAESRSAFYYDRMQGNLHYQNKDGKIVKDPLLACGEKTWIDDLTAFFGKEKQKFGGFKAKLKKMIQK